MSKIKEVSLEDVLNEYVDSERTPTYEALNKWIRLYPQFKTELTEFTANWTLMNELPPVSEAKGIDKATLVLRCMSVFENRLHTLRNPTQNQSKKIKGLLAEGLRLGLTIDQIAEDCRLSVAIVRQLDQRLISFYSIPHQVIDCLSKEIKCNPLVVADYLKRPMTLLEGAKYRSRAAPKLPAEPQNFFDAVQKDSTIKEQDRNYWLSFTPEKK